MKKSALILCFAVTLSSTAFGFYREYETPEPSSLRGQGFSESTIQAVDTAVRLNRGKNSKHNSGYVRKKGKNALGRGYTSIKNYFDPVQDDGQFGEHQIQFTNTWNGDTPAYSRKFSSDYSPENL